MPQQSGAPTAEAGTESVVTLPAELGIDQAAAWRMRLLQQVDKATPVTLDARDVSQIHTAALQLFCMFCNDRRGAGRETHWRQPSAALRNAAALLGITTLLQLSRDTQP